MDKMNEKMNDNVNTTEEEKFKIKGLQEALDLTKAKEEKIRQQVDEVYKLLFNLVEDPEKDFDILDAFSTLAKASVYFTQSYFRDKEEFDNEYAIARELVTKNILQSLGIFAEDEEKNKNSIVTFNGEYDVNNFALRRILLTAPQLTEYALWQLVLTDTFEKKSKELN